MERVASHANVIVPEVLKSDNYKRWSILMRYYLLGQDLWDVVQSNQVRARGNMRRPGNLSSSQYETLTNAISNGKLSNVKKFFKENSNARSARIFEQGYTVLHFAVYNKKEEIVDYLINSKLSKNDLEIKDDSGSTALTIAARFGVGKSIAQKLVRTNKNLLTIPDNNGNIPVQLACRTNKEDMTRYLYRRTPLQSLNVDNRFYIL
ncbi:hypothetical protein SLEP1_g19060 [Rubroshorea leprosula]|nr:hypothetical protein SLEP1_g19060 [Rubroshorea leprosula]